MEIQSSWTDTKFSFPCKEHEDTLVMKTNGTSHHLSFLFHVWIFFSKKRPHWTIKTGTERQMKGSNYLWVNCLRGKLQVDPDINRELYEYRTREWFFFLNKWLSELTPLLCIDITNPTKLRIKIEHLCGPIWKKKMSLNYFSDWEFNWATLIYFTLVITGFWNWLYSP